MNVAGDVARGSDTRTARFFDFEHPEGGLNDFVLTTQCRVRRGTHRQAHDARANLDDDQRMVIPDLVLFVNGILLVVTEVKSSTLADEWKSPGGAATAPLSRGGPEW